MTARFTSRDLSVRVEDGERVVLLSATHGHTWIGLGANEARSMAAALCVAAERLDAQDTEEAHAA